MAGIVGARFVLSFLSHEKISTFRFNSKAEVVYFLIWLINESDVDELIEVFNMYKEHVKKRKKK